MRPVCWSVVTVLLTAGCTAGGSNADQAASSTASTTSSSYSATSGKAFAPVDTIIVTGGDSVIHTGGDLKLDSVIHTGGDLKAYLTAAGDDVITNGKGKVNCQYSVQWAQPPGGKQPHAIVACQQRRGPPVRK